MAWIQKPKRKKQEYNRLQIHETHKFYNNNTWRKLRQSYLMEHPVCEDCLKENKVVLAEEIHHIKPILTGKTELEMMTLAFDSNNLTALCKKCHQLRHKKLRQNSLI